MTTPAPVRPLVSFKFRSVAPVNGVVAVHITAFLPLGITKEIKVSLSPGDTRLLIDRAAAALRALGEEVPRLT